MGNLIRCADCENLLPPDVAVGHYHCDKMGLVGDGLLWSNGCLFYYTPASVSADVPKKTRDLVCESCGSDESVYQCEVCGHGVCVHCSPKIESGCPVCHPPARPAPKAPPRRKVHMVLFSCPECGQEAKITKVKAELLSEQVVCEACASINKRTIMEHIEETMEDVRW